MDPVQYTLLHQVRQPQKGAVRSNNLYAKILLTIPGSLKSSSGCQDLRPLSICYKYQAAEGTRVGAGGNTALGLRHGVVWLAEERSS